MPVKETLMSTVSKTRATTPRATVSWSRRILVHLGWLLVAAAFVALLILTYGLDLSPGLF